MRAIAAAAIAATALLGCAVGRGSSASPGGSVTVALDRPVNSFHPASAIGAGLDGHEQGDTALIYTRRNLTAMRSAGLGAVSYRLRTELGVEAWHWNPSGHWSDQAHRRGYWTSSAHPAGRIGISNGFRLPRRGNTTDQAQDTGYSRLDDGDPSTFWKSNPYLGGRSQWLLVDLGHRKRVDTVRLDWGTPYAKRFRVQYWTGPQAIFLAGHPPGAWRDFPHAAFAGSGGRQTVRIADSPRRARFIRVLMTHGSRTAPPGSRDVRDRLGFAVRELYIGRTQPAGVFTDLVRHVPSAAQTVTFVSSTDPWHRAQDIDRNYEQPGFDRVAGSGLLHGEPMLVPVSVLYGTPANAVAELRWLRARHIPLRGVELGEEPDGQLFSPEDYATLYVRFAKRIHSAFPDLPLGGPGFQTSLPDWMAWPNRAGDRSWTHRFIAALKARNALGLFNFFSFEWYPIDNVCRPPPARVAGDPAVLADVLRRQHQEGVPKDLPIYVSEYGYSAFAGQPEVDLPGALLNAQLVGQLLTLGGDAAYLYGYEPEALMRESRACDSWGNLTLLLSDSNRRIRFRMPTYYGAQLETGAWAGTDPGLDYVYPAQASEPLVHAYALRRADGRVAVLLVNADAVNAHSVRLDLRRGGTAAPATDGLDVFQLSSALYGWHAHGPHGFARPDAPPATTHVGPDDAVALPPFSLTVVRTRRSF
jgi:hypothetical protein